MRVAEIGRRSDFAGGAQGAPLEVGNVQVFSSRVAGRADGRLQRNCCDPDARRESQSPGADASAVGSGANIGTDFRVLGADPSAMAGADRAI